RPHPTNNTGTHNIADSLRIASSLFEPVRDPPDSTVAVNMALRPAAFTLHAGAASGARETAAAPPAG
ncbi:hypothetical protein L2249_25430, partial [Xanthomonas perforans]|uniref:hypothetical protein n=1 Tax=Xanthomonas perforans TaxID=442694 RepID=UPI001F160E7E